MCSGGTGTKAASKKPERTADQAPSLIDVMRVIAPLQGLHNNHHRIPRDAYISHAWYEIDVNGLIIQGPGKLGLVHDVFDGGRASAEPTEEGESFRGILRFELFLE